MCVAPQWRDHKRKFRGSFTTDVSRNNDPQLRCALPKLSEHFAYGRARWNGDVSDKVPRSRRSGHVDNENVIQRAAGKLASERKIQRPLHLSAQLLSLLLYPSTSVSLSMLGFLHGSFKFRID
jgi:hypothetical protein